MKINLLCKIHDSMLQYNWVKWLGLWLKWVQQCRPGEEIYNLVMKQWHEVFRKWLMENISVVWILQLLTKFSVYLAASQLIPDSPELWSTCGQPANMMWGKWTEGVTLKSEFRPDKHQHLIKARSSDDSTESRVTGSSNTYIILFYWEQGLFWVFFPF